MENKFRKVETWQGADLCDYTRLELIGIVQELCEQRDKHFDYFTDKIVELHNKLNAVKANNKV